MLRKLQVLAWQLQHMCVCRRLEWRYLPEATTDNDRAAAGPDDGSRGDEDDSAPHRHDEPGALEARSVPLQPRVSVVV